MQKQRHIKQTRQFLKARGMKGGIGEIRDKTLRQLEYAKGAFENATSRIKNYIKTNPQKALMVAVGLGVAIGVVASHFMNGKTKHGR